MENAKHIGGMAALAVALGVGLAAANTPAVAWAAPGDSGKGPSSGGSSQSSEKPSAKRASSTTDDTPKRDRRPQHRRGDTAASNSVGSQDDTPTDSSGSVATTADVTPSTPTPSTKRAGTRATPESSETDVRQRGGDTSRPGSAFTPAKTSPNLAVVSAAADPAPRTNSPDLTRVSSTATEPAMTPPRTASRVTAPADRVSGVVSTLINAALSPSKGAPTSPAEPPAALALLAFARREFEQAMLIPTRIVNRPAGQVTSAAVDPDFISNTHNFGLFSVTSAADPSDNHFVAFVFSTPFFTNVLTSGTDPEDNLGFGAASIGVAGHTVNTFISPFLNFSIAIPIEDPFAELFTELVRLGF